MNVYSWPFTRTYETLPQTGFVSRCLRGSITTAIVQFPASICLAQRSCAQNTQVPTYRPCWIFFPEEIQQFRSFWFAGGRGKLTVHFIAFGQMQWFILLLSVKSKGQFHCFWPPVTVHWPKAMKWTNGPTPCKSKINWTVEFLMGPQQIQQFDLHGGGGRVKTVVPFGHRHWFIPLFLAKTWTQPTSSDCTVRGSVI